MESTNLAIVGLGKVGTFFLKQLLAKFDLGLNILCAVEPAETEGKAYAKENGVVIVDTDTLISFEDDVDLIFNLTGLESVSHELREKLDASGNDKTEIISDKALKMMWTMLTDEKLPS